MSKDAPLAKDAPPSVTLKPKKLRSSTYYAARRSSSGDSGYMQVTVAVLFSTPWQRFVKYVA
jgi:hypothetical protein